MFRVLARLFSHSLGRIALAFLLVLSLAVPVFSAGMTSAYLENHVLYVKCAQCSKYVTVNRNGVVAAADDFLWKGDTIVFRQGTNLYSIVDIATGQYEAVAQGVTDYAIDDSTIVFNSVEPNHGFSRTWLYVAPDPRQPQNTNRMVHSVAVYSLDGSVLAFSNRNVLYVAADVKRPLSAEVVSSKGGYIYRVIHGLVTYQEMSAQSPGLYVVRALNTVTGRPDVQRITDRFQLYTVGRSNLQPYIAYVNNATLFIVTDFDHPLPRQINDDNQVINVKVSEDVVAFHKRDYSLHLALGLGVGGSIFVSDSVVKFSPAPHAVGYLTANGDFYVVPEINRVANLNIPGSTPLPKAHSVRVAAQVENFALGDDGAIVFLANHRAYYVTDKNTGAFRLFAENATGVELKSGVAHVVQGGTSRPLDYFFCQNALTGGFVP